MANGGRLLKRRGGALRKGASVRVAGNLASIVGKARSAEVPFVYALSAGIARLPVTIVRPHWLHRQPVTTLTLPSRSKGSGRRTQRWNSWRVRRLQRAQ
jgi:hypothetical protein